MSNARYFFLFTCNLGVSDQVDLDEIQMMASEPVCLHRFLLSDFTEVEALTSVIEKRSCEGEENIHR